MTDYDIIQDGWHELSGFCECTFRGKYDDQVINALIVRIDGTNYLCYEDPADGYRSYSELRRTTRKCTNTFPPQIVAVTHYNRNDDRGIQFYNEDFELVLLIGTDNYDDYYPMAVWEWHPELLPANKTMRSPVPSPIHSPVPEPPAELTAKIHQMLTTPGTNIGTVIDLASRHFRVAYATGMMDVVKRIEQAVGPPGELCKGTPTGRYAKKLAAVIEELRRYDPKYK